MTLGNTSGIYMRGVWGSSPSDVFAVGEADVEQPGLILHYDGATWSLMYGWAPNSLIGVWGSSSTDVFAVGRNGEILHYGPRQ